MLLRRCGDLLRNPSRLGHGNGAPGARKTRMGELIAGPSPQLARHALTRRAPGCCTTRQQPSAVCARTDKLAGCRQLKSAVISGARFDGRHAVRARGGPHRNVGEQPAGQARVARGWAAGELAEGGQQQPWRAGIEAESRAARSVSGAPPAQRVRWPQRLRPARRPCRCLLRGMWASPERTALEGGFAWLRPRNQLTPFIGCRRSG